MADGHLLRIEDAIANYFFQRIAYLHHACAGGLTAEEIERMVESEVRDATERSIQTHIKKRDRERHQR